MYSTVHLCCEVKPKARNRSKYPIFVTTPKILFLCRYGLTQFELILKVDASAWVKSALMSMVNGMHYQRKIPMESK